MATVGSGTFTYELVKGWDKLPPGWEYTQVAGVAVDSQDRAYVFNRGEHPMAKHCIHWLDQTASIWIHCSAREVCVEG